MSPVESQWLARGRITALSRQGAREPEALVYSPTSLVSGRPALVCVHGIQRNVLELAVRFAPLADELGRALLLPFFSTRRGRGYQRLRGRRVRRHPEARLHQALDRLGELAPVDLERFDLFGYSGGAQFAHRYALVHPTRVRTLVCASAGWYTFPDESTPWPYGLAIGRRDRRLEPDLGAFLDLRTHVVVGAEDRGRDDSLNADARIDALQGETRVERARRYVDALRESARAHGRASRVTLQVLPGCGHSFEQNVRAGRLVDVVGDVVSDHTRSRHDPLSADPA